MISWIDMLSSLSTILFMSFYISEAFPNMDSPDELQNNKIMSLVEIN